MTGLMMARISRATRKTTKSALREATTKLAAKMEKVLKTIRICMMILRTYGANLSRNHYVTPN